MGAPNGLGSKSLGFSIPLLSAGEILSISSLVSTPMARGCNWAAGRSLRQKFRRGGDPTLLAHSMLARQLINIIILIAQSYLDVPDLSHHVCKEAPPSLADRVYIILEHQIAITLLGGGTQYRSSLTPEF